MLVTVKSCQQTNLEQDYEPAVFATKKACKAQDN